MSKTDFDPALTPPTLTIEGDLSFGTAADIRTALLEAFEEARDRLRIDVSDVETIDLAGVQLLYAARRTADARGIDLEVEYGKNAKRFEKLYGFAGLKPLDAEAGSTHAGT
jgi:anti-anti-sigma regulatory factor